MKSLLHGLTAARMMWSLFPAPRRPTIAIAGVAAVTALLVGRLVLVRRIGAGDR